jgi:hypothetical protein
LERTIESGKLVALQLARTKLASRLV